MDIHFYITPGDLERYNKEGACYVTTDHECNVRPFLHISINLIDHTIERLEKSEQYILRKIT